jgi:hypothetical protein
MSSPEAPFDLKVYSFLLYSKRNDFALSIANRELKCKSRGFLCPALDKEEEKKSFPKRFYLIKNQAGILDAFRSFND